MRHFAQISYALITEVQCFHEGVNNGLSDPGQGEREVLIVAEFCIECAGLPQQHHFLVFKCTQQCVRMDLEC